MRLAIPYENDQICQHFGHCENFKIYEIQEGQILSSEVVACNTSGHDGVAAFLQAESVALVICGGIGAGAQNALIEARIAMYAGVSGGCDEAVTLFLQGQLGYVQTATCGQSHDESAGHSCGSGCGGCSGGCCH